MKKVILFSFFLVSLLGVTSCTTDEIQTPAQNQVADDTGGQQGVPPPPPPPPPPGTGTGKTF